jgi:hypothetical protein
MAADPRIIQYIRQQMDAGFRKQQIYDALLQAGWYKEEIDQAFYEVANQAYAKEPQAAPPEQVSDELHPKKPLPEKPGFFWKLRNALFHPGRLFEAVKNEKGISKALGFFGIVTFINFLVVIAFAFFAPAILTGFLTGFVMGSPLSGIITLLPLFIQVDIVSLLITYVAVFAATLIAAGIIHAFVWMLRGSKGFQQTYKAFMYSFAPFIFLWVFIPLAYFVPELLAFSLIFTAFAAALLLWQLFLVIRGLSKLHEISGIKALATVFFPIVIVAAIVFFILPSTNLSFLNMLNPSSYLGGAGTATGFGELGMPSEWQYKYDGSFSITLKNNGAVPITINSVTANCGTDGSTVVLETLAPMHLESGGGITYSTGDEKCALKEPGESYSVSVTVRYLQETSFLKTASGTVTGRVG